MWFVFDFVHFAVPLQHGLSQSRLQMVFFSFFYPFLFFFYHSFIFKSVHCTEKNCSATEAYRVFAFFFFINLFFWWRKEKINIFRGMTALFIFFLFLFFLQAALRSVVQTSDAIKGKRRKERNSEVTGIRWRIYRRLSAEDRCFLICCLCARLKITGRFVRVGLFFKRLQTRRALQAGVCRSWNIIVITWLLNRYCVTRVWALQNRWPFGCFISLIPPEHDWQFLFI